MYELAKSGWEGNMDADSDESEDEADRDWNNSTLSTIPLIQQADLLARASKNTWVNFQHPRLVYLFQNIHLSAATAPVKQILKRLRQTGATIICTDDPTPNARAYSLSSPPPIQSLISSLLSQERYAHFSETLNIDCTVLYTPHAYLPPP